MKPMEKKPSARHRAAGPKTSAGRFRTGYATIPLLLLLLALPAAVQAQDFGYTTNNGSITITNYTGSGGDVTIPDTITGLPVTSIGSLAFEYHEDLTSVTIPSSVTSIGYGAFVLCTNLSSVTILNSVTTQQCYHHRRYGLPLLHQADQHHGPEQRHQHRFRSVL